jgi:hypothetical protein
MDVFHGDDTFNLDKLQLTHPNSIAGGSYMTRYSYCESKQPLYIQTTKTQSKQGVIIIGKKAHIDLLLTTSDADTEFIEWITNLEKRSVDLLYEKRHMWFTQELDRTDIENSFTSPIRAYKTGNFLLRVNIESNRNFTHIQPFSCKIFNENKQVVPVEYIKAEHHIISIIEFQGIRFTSRNFQIELLLRQVLVIPDVPLFETCVIADPSQRNLIKDSVVIEAELEANANEANANEANANANANANEANANANANANAAEYLGMIHELEPEDERDTLKHFEFTEVDIDFKNIPDTIDTREPEFKMEPDPHSAGAASLSTITTFTTANTIKLKKHKDVLYEMYKVAKHKAQEAKKAAIRAYLEAKEIKAAYLLDDSDSSEDDDNDNYNDNEL